MVQQPSTSCPTPSTVTPTPSVVGGGLWKTNSVMSFGSRCTIRSGSARSVSPPTPKSRSHGYDGGRPRCFSSRHVPSVAEEIVQIECWSPSVKMRFNGLMKHLKKNSAFQDRQKEILFKEAAESFVAEEFDEALRSEFERRCAFGERMNTELMSSAKWVKLLQDIGAIPVTRGGPAPAPSRSGVSPSKAAALAQAPAQAGKEEDGLSPQQTGSVGVMPSITLAEADIIFHKVVHNCDHGAKRLTYELFCKALALASHALWPDLDEETAFSEILSKVVSMAPEEVQDGASLVAQDCMLNANVLLVLDHFKPALHDLFSAFCHRNLSNPSSASHGMGTVRMKERTIWKHTQDTIMSSSMLGAEPTRFPGEVGGVHSAANSDCGDAALRDGTLGAGPGSGSIQGLSPSSPVPGRMSGSGQLTSPPREVGGSPLRAWMDVRPSGASFAESLGMSPRSTLQSKSPKAQKKDPYLYASGAPVLRSRRQHMSCDQLINLCKELKVLPESLTRLEIVKVFKRAQCSGQYTLRGSSVHGYLSRETFVDAIGQLAIEAFSKEPFCDEYPEAHEKIYAFLLNHLPDQKRKVQMHDRFLYGRSC